MSGSSGPSSSRSPRWVGALLERLLPRPHGALVRAELDAEYEHFVVGSRGRFRARLWYWRQAAGTIAGQLRRDHRILPPQRDPVLRSVLRDLRFGFRSFLRDPLFTTVALVTLAVGIGATTLVFAVLNAVLLRPLPYPEADRLVRMWSGWNVSKDVTERIIDGSESFEILAGVIGDRQPLSGRGEPVELRGEVVTDGYFALTGAVPLAGRVFTAADSELGAESVVILSEGLWESAFGRAAATLGSEIDLGGRRRTVVGIVEAGQRPLTAAADFWTPMTFDRDDFSDYSGVAQVLLYGRLAEGVSPEQAAADTRRMAEGVQELAPDAFGEDWVAASAPRPLHDVLVEDSRSRLWVVMAAVSFLLLIACANVASLLLARSTRRQREMAIRVGLGAGPARLWRQMLTESLLLGLAGGGGGILLSFLLLDGLRVLLPSSLPLSSYIALDFAAAGFALAASVATSVLFGLAPAIRASRADAQAQLRAAAPSVSIGRGGTRVNRMFVMAELALAVILVTGAGLMLRTLGELSRVDPGFHTESVMAARLQLPESTRYAEAPQKRTYFDAVVERLASAPGVEAAGAVTFLPMAAGLPSAVYQVNGVEYPADRPRPNANFQLVQGDYFDALGTRLLRGRLHDALIDGEVLEGVVNETFVREAFGDEDPLGRTVTMFGATEFVVVGVVSDSRQRGPTQPPDPEVFFSYQQAPMWQSMYVVVRTAPGAGFTAEDLRAVIWQVDSDVPISALRSMEEVVSSAYADSRFLARVLGAFALLALLLGAVGVYGVMSYTVGERRWEFGIRRAMGASSRDILGRALLGALAPAATGIVAGTLAAAVGAGWLRGLLFGITPHDPVTFAAVPLLLLLVALAATWIPARRAAKVDPKISLGA